jgi:hypothetical protein
MRSWRTFHIETIIIAQMWKQLKCAVIDEWMKKIQHIHTIEYYSALK